MNRRAWRGRRLAARIRARIPALFLIPGVVAGQLLVFGFARAALGIMTAVFVLGLLTNRTGLLLTSGLLVGVVSALRIGDVNATPTVPPDGKYRVQVLYQPRYPSPGAISLVLSVREAPEGARHLSRLLCRAVHLPGKNIFTVKQGDVLTIKGKVSPLAASGNPFDRDSRLKFSGIDGRCKIRYASLPSRSAPGYIQRAQAFLVQGVKGVLGYNERAGLLLSMSLGTRDVLSERTEEAFRKTGLSHVLVLSGYQVTLVYHLAYSCLCFLGLRLPAVSLFLPLKPVAAIVALLVSLLFVLVSGMEPSGARAALSLLFVVTASILERGGGLAGSIAVSFVCLSLLWPCCYLEPGVQLTYAALVGILIGGGGGRLGWRSYLRLCWMVSLCTSAVSLIWFERVSLAGFLLNPVFAPLLSVLGCQVTLAAMALYFLRLDAGGGLLFGLAWLLERIRNFIVTISKLEIASAEVSNPLAIVSLLSAAVMLVAFRRVSLWRRQWNV